MENSAVGCIPGTWTNNTARDNFEADCTEVTKAGQECSLTYAHDKLVGGRVRCGSSGMYEVEPAKGAFVTCFIHHRLLQCNANLTSSLSLPLCVPEARGVSQVSGDLRFSRWRAPSAATVKHCFAVVCSNQHMRGRHLRRWVHLVLSAQPPVRRQALRCRGLLRT